VRGRQVQLRARTGHLAVQGALARDKEDEICQRRRRRVDAGVVGMSVTDVLRTQLSTRPDADAVSDGDGGWWTWRDLADRSDRVARELENRGVGAGDVVAILDVNRSSYFAVWFGTVQIGAALLAMNTRFTAVELADVLEDAQARLLLVGPDFVATSEAIRSAERAVATEFVALTTTPDGQVALEGDSPVDQPVAHVRHAQGSDVELLLYTSGTTGRPKGVPVTGHNLDAMASWCADALELSDGATSSIYLPLFHVAGASFAIVTLMAGGRCVVRPSFDAVDFISSGTTYGVTHSLLVPSAIAIVLDELETRSDELHLEVLAYGASPIPDSVLGHAITRFGCRFVQFYGATETTGAVTFLAPDDHAMNDPRLRSCGRAARGVELRIVSSASGAPVATGVVGEICVRSQQIMPGYWNQPTATFEAIDPEGWYHTGDLGYLDREGYLYVHDRLKDMIVTGGENVYPAEVENVIHAHPAVAEVAVIGVPSDRWGEQVHALVVLRRGHDLDAAALFDHTRASLASYKCPKSVDFVQSLPRNPSGKVLRRELREPYWQSAYRPVG
jgi:acyl-CoA synthetase (AMP-forming)/AMP-acid ligase II